jgi:hypothetical protein
MSSRATMTARVGSMLAESFEIRALATAAPPSIMDATEALRRHTTQGEERE